MYVTLAYIAGTCVVVYYLKSVCMNSYEEFKFESAILSQLYSEKSNGKLKPFTNMTYWQYLKAKWFGICCDQGKNAARFLNARKQLEDETDILLIVKQLRVLRALANERFSAEQIIGIVNESDVHVIQDDENRMPNLQRSLGVPSQEVTLSNRVSLARSSQNSVLQPAKINQTNDDSSLL